MDLKTLFSVDSNDLMNCRYYIASISDITELNLASSLMYDLIYISSNIYI